MKYFNETYKKREFLRRNEWADTYRATHAVTDEHVTLKVLAKKSNDEEYIKRLRIRKAKLEGNKKLPRNRGQKHSTKVLSKKGRI